MFYKKKSIVLYRDYLTFGLITDNSNFSYKQQNKKFTIGEKILSQSGSVFFAALTREPQSIDEIVNKIQKSYHDIDFATISNDAIAFFNELEQDGFVASGATFQDCEDKDFKFTYGNDQNLSVKKASCSQENFIQSTHDFLNTFYKGNPYLTNLHIEITSKCNEKCVHCYIPSTAKALDMDSMQFLEILEQCRDLRILHLTISGGEPMLHKDFCNFLRKCREYDMSVNVLTNLTLLNNDILKELEANPLLGVQVSLYSMDPLTHDEITQVDGSFQKTFNGIQKLIEHNIPMQISCPIMKQNKGSYIDVKNWAAKYGIDVGDDYVIIAKYDHTTENLNNRLSISEVSEIIIKDASSNNEYFNRLEENAKTKREMSPNDFICSICNSSVCIAENGNVYPCAGWQDCVLGNVNQRSIEDIWNNSEKTRYLRNLRLKDFPKCIICPDKEFCTMCMVRNANEDPYGNPLEVNKFFCEIAKQNRLVYSTYKK